MTPPVPDRGALDRMLDNSGWLRALALELLNDPSLADDVLQEVWMTALRRPPDGEEPRSQRSWLKKVLRTFALRANRSQRRRRRWEKEAPPPPTEPSPEEMIERLEMQGRLAEAIRSLPEPYRSVVFLRFYEQQDPQSVAASRGVPASTVRTQLQRGLGLLRTRLDEQQPKDRPNWRASLVLMLGAPQALPIPAPPPTQATPAASGGASIQLFRWVAAVTIVTLGSIAVWSVATEHRHLGSRSDGQALAERAANSTKREGSAATTVSREESVSAAARSDTATVAEQRPQPREREREYWPLIVLSERTEQPVEGAALFLAGVDEPVGECLGRSDAAGALLIPAEEFCRESIRIFAPGYVEYREPARRRTLDEGSYVVRMTPIPRCTVTVLRPDQTPAVDVSVRLEPTLALPAELAEVGAATTAHTDARGQATFDVPFHDPVVIIDTTPWALVIRRWTTPDLTVTLENGLHRNARLVDHRGEGIPLAHVELRGAGWGVPRVRRTDEDGRFPIGRLVDESSVEIRAYPEGRPAIAIRSTPPAAGEWAIEVPAGVSFTGRILGPDGAPAVGAIPFLVRREAVPEPTASMARSSSSEERRAIPALRTHDARGQRRARFRLVPYSRGITSGDGSFVVGPIAAPDELYLLVHHPTLINRVVALDSASESDVEVELEAGRAVSGVVVDPIGKPMAGVVLHVGERFTNDTESVLGRVRTGADGRFTVTVPAAQSAHRGLERDAVFVTAFHPDELLAKSWERLEESRVYRSAIIEPSDDDVTLVAASSPHARDFAFRFYDETGQPFREWTPTTVFDGQGNSFDGAVTAFASTIRFHSDVNLAGSGPWTLVARAPDHRWQVLSVEAPGRAPIDVTLEAASTQPTRVRFVTADGSPVARRTVAIDVSPDPRTPCLIVVGRTESDGALPASTGGCVPRGPRPVFVSLDAKSAPPGTPVEFEETRWIAVGMRDLSVEQLGIPLQR